MTEFTIDQALQKAIEAHKAGQVQEADRLYTAILKAQPKHPDANHNMGVLTVGVRKVEQALPFFKTALEAKPSTAQFWLSYIDALIKLGRLADAKAVFDQAKSKGAKGDGFDKLEQRLNEADEEPVVSKPATEAPLPQPNILDSLKLDQAIKLAKKKAKDGAPEEAKRVYQDILTKFPKNKRASDGLKVLAGKSVGKASKAEHAPKDVLQSLIALYNNGQLALVVEQAQILTKQYPKAFDVWNLMGASAAQIGQLDQAIVAFKRVIAIKPDIAEAYSNMGIVLRKQGKLEEAIDFYNKALAINPDYAGAQHIVSSLTGKTTTSAPRQYVESLFDGYAKKFEESLVGTLEYKIPKLLADIIVKERGSGSLGSVLDLGCGTGLMGVEIKDYCSNLEGIDLSKKMLGLADEKKVYDKLIHTDILDYLADTDLCFDLFIATDVLVYVGDLTELFRLIKSRNKRKGKLVFSTEHTELDGFQLEKTGRYSHSKTYIEELCANFKYTISHFSMQNLRKDNGQFITGGLYILDF